MEETLESKKIIHILKKKKYRNCPYPKKLHLHGICIKERIQIKTNVAVSTNDLDRENKINGAK
jgi:hypothetical protein